jgi:hypothetical protein
MLPKEKFPAKPLSSDEINDSIYRILRERARREAEFNAKYRPNSPAQAINVRMGK